MKKYSILLLLFVSGFCINNSIARTISNDPGYKVTVYTKEGYKLEGLLLSATDSQLLIYPGKYKEWKKKVKYITVYYHFRKIQKLQLKKTGPLLAKSHGKKNEGSIFMLNGDIESFRLFRKSLPQ
jgi:hypothetical protein